MTKSIASLNAYISCFLCQTGKLQLSAERLIYSMGKSHNQISTHKKTIIFAVWSRQCKTTEKYRPTNDFWSSD